MKRRKLPPLDWRIAKLELRPGDMLVWQTDLILDKDQIAAIRDRLREQLAPLNMQNRVLVLSAGAKLAILRKREKPRTTK